MRSAPRQSYALRSNCIGGRGSLGFARLRSGRPEAVRYLRGSGYYEDSLIIFFSDQGESLGEKDGYYGHGVSNAGRLGDVPLLVHYPDVQPRVSNAAVSITSIAPSVWHYLNQSIPGAVSACLLLLPESALAACPKPISALFGSGLEAFDKIIRKPLRTRGQLEARQRSVARWQRFAPEVTAVSSEHRYLRNLKSGVEHVYRRGPEERHDLIREQPELLRGFRHDVVKWQRAEAERLVCQLSE
jgi:arylsulfatase A-like enzyme